MPSQRIADDFYETHEKGLVETMMRYWGHTPGTTVLEPCNGKGAISNILKYKGFQVTTNDLNEEYGADYSQDVTKIESWGYFPTCDYVITNPPYKEASKIIKLAYKHASEGVVALLRLSFLEPCSDRGEWLKEHPPSKVIVLNPRPRFRTDTKGSDSVTSAWFYWEKNKRSYTTQLGFGNDWKSK